MLDELEYIKKNFKCAKGRFSFPCVSGLCPYGKDPMNDCYPKLPPTQRMLFDELVFLRSRIAIMNGLGKVYAYKFI